MGHDVIPLYTAHLYTHALYESLIWRSLGRQDLAEELLKVNRDNKKAWKRAGCPIHPTVDLKHP